MTATYEIGADAACSDGPCGTVTQVVVDPVARAVTHLVVEPRHRSGLGKLVPVAQVSVTEDGVGMSCSVSEFDHLPAAEVTHFLPGTTGGYGGFGPGEALYWPYYGLGGTGGLGASGLAMGSVIPPVTVEDTLPAGERAIRRGDPVQCTDGEVGRVQGLVVDGGSGAVTHILLQEGHFWDRRKVTIPISAVRSFGELIELSLSKADVEALPDVEFDDLNG